MTMHCSTAVSKEVAFASEKHQQGFSADRQPAML